MEFSLCIIYIHGGVLFLNNKHSVDVIELYSDIVVPHLSEYIIIQAHFIVLAYIVIMNNEYMSFICMCR